MKTFKRGGVHPEENKLSENQPIEVLSVPKRVTILLGQNLGASSKPVVNKRDKVKVGQLIAKGEAFISANLHSPVSGTILKIDDVPDQVGHNKAAIVIDVDGDEWVEGIVRSSEIAKDIKLSKEEIVKKIQEMGIVGLGGAAFPTHIKLMVPEGKVANVLIINGVECEPYLTADHRLMLEKGEELLIGISILMKGLGVSKAIIGIENNKADAIHLLKELANNFLGIEVQSLKVKYPQGGEKQLIKALINREVPSGKLPLDVGCVVSNVGTAFAVYEAVQKNKPLIERVVSVTGKSVIKPSNLLVRIGTPISDLIEKVEGLPEDTGKIIGGGPMMGKTMISMNAAVVKGTSGILVMRENESSRIAVKDCIRCAKCVSVCPMGLSPYLLAIYGEQERYEDAGLEDVMDCIECGSCHYICPSGRPLLDYLRVDKVRVGEIMRNR